jgi:hypothetical protein
MRKIPIYAQLRKWLFIQKELAEWETNGRLVPPPHIVKELTLKTYSKRYGLKILVETGTYRGEMIEAMKDVFNHIYSIELSQELYEQAKERFKALKHVELIHGNSGAELGKVISRINHSALFWLDSHYSGGNTARGEKDTPIYEELHHIFDAQDKGHVIIIDDSRLFGIDPAYPSIEELNDFIKSKRTNVNILVQDDSIRIIPINYDHELIM